MKFTFLKNILVGAKTFFVTKPLVAAGISLVTLTGVTATGVVVYNNVVEDKQIEDNQDENEKVVIKDTNKDLESNEDEVTNEELEELLANQDENEENNEEETNETSSNSTSSNNTSSQSINSSNSTVSSVSKNNTSNSTSNNTSNHNSTSNNISNNNSNSDNSSNNTSNSGSSSNSDSSSNQTTPSVPNRPSGIDTNLSTQCYNAVALSTSNINYPDVVSTLNSYVDDLIFNQKQGIAVVKSALENYTLNGYKIIYRAQVEEVILPDGFAISDFKNKIKKYVIDNYMYVKVYWNNSDKKYHIYYVGASLDHDNVYYATN